MNENSLLEAEVRSLQRKLIKRDAQILKQDRELHKLRVIFNVECQPRRKTLIPFQSVLQQANSLISPDKNGLGSDQEIGSEKK